MSPSETSSLWHSTAGSGVTPKPRCPQSPSRRCQPRTRIFRQKESWLDLVQMQTQKMLRICKRRLPTDADDAQSCHDGESSTRNRLSLANGRLWRAAGVTITLFSVLVSTASATVSDHHDLEQIANKEWSEIANVEMLYVYEQYFGNGERSKFRPGFCAERTYYAVDDETSERIENRVAEFESEAKLRDYGYDLYESSRPCKGAFLMLGIYDDSHGKDRFLFEMESKFPFLVSREDWAEFKDRLHGCGTLGLWSESMPYSIVLTISAIDLRKPRYRGSLDACITRTLTGALGAVSEKGQNFSLMGFSDDVQWKFSTTLIKMLYHPLMKYGALTYAERKPVFLEILNKIRPGR